MSLVKTTIGFICASVALLALAPAALAAPRPGGADFSCRASVFRVALKVPVAQTLEPFIANAPDAPCVPDRAGLFNPTPVGPVTVDIASAETTQTPANLATAPAANGDNATARASVTNPVIALPGAAISAAVLNANAAYTCQGGQSVPTASTTVTGLIVNGTAVSVPPGNAPLTIPLGPAGSLTLNQIVQEPNRVTARALVLTTPVTDVVIAEAIVDILGNPCALAAAKPQCSDGIDNDGDGLADALDPGCLSGPGGAYDPNDNSEINFPCSDRADNDGDGLIDAQDPGCLSGPGGTYNPMDPDERNTECSDRRDNDGDGKIDFPADKGCTSAADNSERTASGTSRLGSNPGAIARLGLRGPCVRGSFAATVTGRSIDRVVFSLDGRRLSTVGSSPFTTRISTAKSGTHRVTARVTFLSDSRTAARTLGFGFKRCAAPVRFTG